MTVFEDLGTFYGVPGRLADGGARCQGGPATAMAGYTLLELMAILIIVGILAAVLAPRFLGTSGFTGQTTADKLLAAARYAETLAQNQGVTTALTVGANSFSVTQGGVAVVSPTLQSAHLVIPLPAGVTITPQTTVNFVRPGIPSATPTFTITGTGFKASLYVTTTGYIYECGSQGACPP